jgi:hypothetical protein
MAAKKYIFMKKFSVVHNVVDKGLKVPPNQSGQFYA